jgi:hypothetical protein
MGTENKRLSFDAGWNVWIDGITDGGYAAGARWPLRGRLEAEQCGMEHRRDQRYVAPPTGNNEAGEVVGTWDGGLPGVASAFTTYVDHGYG